MAGHIINRNEICGGKYISPFSHETWTTLEGDRFKVAFMRTEHLFFAFRMLYDRVADRYGWPLARRHGVGRQARETLSDQKLAFMLAGFATDIIGRGDLDESRRPEFLWMIARLLQAEEGSQIAQIESIKLSLVRGGEQ